MKRKTRMEKGITLIALIITIVVLLILAAVAISSITNDGILSYATNATKDYNQASKNEQTMLQDYLDYLKVNDANSSVLDGKGTETEPYVISSIEDFILFGYDVNEGNSYQGKYVKLEKDLDFNSDASYENASRTNYERYGYEGNLKTALTSGEGFIPIGKTFNSTEGGNSFSGIFDGNGKTISNLRINKENKILTDIGLFTANLGEIKNLGVKNCNININCSEKVYEAVSCGIICGYNWGKINNCWTSGNVEVIWNAANTIWVGTIAGGGANTLNAEASISNCYNKTNVNAVMSSSKELNVGGILGGGVNLPINNCYNIGNISATHNSTGQIHVGGILALGNGRISKCYNIGKINGKMTSGTPRTGGVIGAYSTGDVDYCCNIGNITYEGTSAKYVGTLLGLTEGTLSNSYALTNATLNGIGRNYSSTSEPTKVNTVAEMPTVLEIVGNGFKADTNNINNGYPILNWQ